MNRIFQADLGRIKKDKLYWMCTMVAAASCFFVLINNYRIQKEYDFTSYLEESIFSFLVPLLLVLPIFLSLSIGTEYSDGTIRNKISVGCRRRDIYFAQLLAGCLGSVFSCLLVFLLGCMLGIPLLGLPRTLSAIFVPLLDGFLLCIASAAIYTMISMNLSSKSHTVMACLLTVFLLLFAALYISMKLAAPEFMEQTIMTDGVLSFQTVENPAYISGFTREICQFFYDLLPTGQALQIAGSYGAGYLRMGLLSAAITVVASAAGYALFLHKDIK